MTTANDPSVAELVVKLKDRLRADTQFGGNKDYPIANSELRQIVRALEGLERRCAEMEKLIRRHVAREELIKRLGETYSFPELDSDEYKELLAERESIFECARILLPPERANECIHAGMILAGQRNNENDYCPDCGWFPERANDGSERAG